MAEIHEELTSTRYCNFADDAKVYQHILANEDELKLQACVDKFVKLGR